MDTTKRGLSWATKMIRANWEIIHAIWLHRNDAVHEKQKLKELEGVPLLNQVIKRHWNVGVRRLPLTEFSYMFRITLTTDLIKKSVDTKKSWLATVKRARKMYEKESYIEDEFDNNEALAKWIDLNDNWSLQNEGGEDEEVLEEENRPSNEESKDRT